MTDSFFITGATGFLGTQITRQILADSPAQIIALVRAPDQAAAQKRLEREWWDFPALRQEIGARVQVAAGDLSTPCFGMEDHAYQVLIRQTTQIIHAAADIRLFAPLAELREVNVTGTQTVLEFARAVQRDHGLQRLAHISTAYVAGRRLGAVREDDLRDDDGFLSPYEQSKYEAEQLVRRAAGKLPVSIFRPGMIVGDSRSGVIKTFNTLYTPLRLYLTGRFSVSPARPDAKVNLVPVDYVARAVVKLALDPRAVGRTFHLTPPAADSPTQAQLAAYARDWAGREMGIHLPPARFIPLPPTKLTSWLFPRIMGRELSSFADLLPYFQNQPVFLRQNSDELLGPYPYRWQDLAGPLLSYAVSCSFWQRSTRTVHEQIMLRLQSRSKPVVYHDMVGGQITPRSSADLRAEIEALIRALAALGISAGDRVAVVGPNHSRYFSILVACGLAGVVVVPLYATSPPAEIESLLRDCQPKLFLVGSPDVHNRLDEIQFKNPVVSFSPFISAHTTQRPVIAWQDFLKLGAGKPHAGLVPIALDAPAAIFYTSGTTGQPKGLVYQHAQLRWLAETLASMYPWRERNRWGAYLSYLPMNHVVEGILATYSPYYVPAALDIYFLAEFNALPAALLTARPTIFFSVPRFFEKVRAAFGENRLAGFYAKTGPGFLRRVLRRLLLRGLLHKTGLDRCKQIIVGSAPSSPDLLNFFHDLGVEIHNAYGLTEAPLVTLNRLGRNQRETLGEALPDTEIHIDPDGEIYIRGPQVAAGYLENKAVLPFPGGWLSSGDLGALTADGYLSIYGRKKDIIITAYGNNIFPAPIEAGLRSIPGVGEALLIGEGRSYCIALIWLEGASPSTADLARIRVGIDRVNASLSHAEQIKRWAIIPDPLTVMNGSLTGSMKLKREVLSRRFNQVIDALYQDEAPAPDVIFGSLGRLEKNSA
jgi:long-chain acyl-CoA synthetase